jgi:5-methylthioadenosine/S-adenosylhomocysteine deaminase
MIKVIKNGLVITMDKERKEKYQKLDIVIDDDKIKEVTTNYTGKYDVEIDATNKIVMPGLINAHTHLGMSIFRATNDNMNLDQWLKEKIWPREAKLSNEDVYYTTLLSCLEMIKTGTTMSNDMYFNCDGSIKALKETKVRSLFSRCLMDNDDLGQERIKEFLKLYNDNKDNKLISFAVAPHAFYTCSKEYLKECSDLALRLNLPFHIHFCENMNEYETIKKMYHEDPVDALEEVGLFRNKLILAHATFVSSYGLNKLKDKDVSLVHNPISNLNLGCGIADISKYRRYVNVCLGTDGQGSGNNMNLFYHMSMVDLLQKGTYKDPTIFSSYEVLEMATINGAKALGVDKIVGSIEVGKQADIIIVDLNNIESYPTVDVITNLVHNTQNNNVNTTIVAGEILMREHRLELDINEELLKEKINAIVKNLK